VLYQSGTDSILPENASQGKLRLKGVFQPGQIRPHREPQKAVRNGSQFTDAICLLGAVPRNDAIAPPYPSAGEPRRLRSSRGVGAPARTVENERLRSDLFPSDTVIVIGRLTFLRTAEH
jgi:hypothetical protein